MDVIGTPGHAAMPQNMDIWKYSHGLANVNEVGTHGCVCSSAATSNGHFEIGAWLRLGHLHLLKCCCF
jgi:hypothetical protein